MTVAHCRLTIAAIGSAASLFRCDTIAQSVQPRVPRPIHHFLPIASVDDRRYKHYAFVYGRTPNDPDGRRFAGVRGAPDAEDSNVYWFEQFDREWLMVPEANEDGSWRFVLRPTDRRIWIEAEQRAVRQSKGDGPFTLQDTLPMLTNVAARTVCGLPLGRDLSGPDFDRHRLRNYLWKQLGVYTRSCRYCLQAIEDVS